MSPTPSILTADTFMLSIDAQYYCSWTFLVSKFWTQGSNLACLNLIFISDVRDADDSTFSIDRDLVLNMISEGREIHVVSTEVTIMTPKIPLLPSFSCFNQFPVVRVRRERSLYLGESVSKFRLIFTRLPACSLSSTVVPICYSRSPVDMILGCSYAFLSLIPTTSRNGANFSMEPRIFRPLT
jgi:hypothetical protein